MKRNFKLLLLSIGIILVISFAFGCTDDTQDPDDDIPVVKDTMTISAGFLNEKYIENDTMIIEFGYIKGDNEAYEGNLKLQTEDSNLFDDLEPLEHYMISYDDAYNLISIESNKVVKELMLKGQMANGIIESEEITPSEDVDTSNLTLLDSYSIDIYGDEEDETISMYTDAEKDPEGNIMWDDGQTWKMIVEGMSDSFILFDDYLQLASVEYFIYTIDEDFYISTVNSGTANLTMTEYKYNKENNTFEKAVKSNTSGNVNMIHKSISGF